MELSDRDIKNLESIARTLENSLNDVNDILARAKAGTEISKPKTAKQLREEKIEYYVDMINSGKLRRRKK